MNPSIGSRGACALLLAAALLAGSEAFAAAVLQSESSSFGPDTITFDSASGKRWLDLTESTSISHTQILVEVAVGGLFEGYHLATDAEIAQLFADAGIDLGPGTNDFVPQNYDAIVALTNLIGVLGTNGSCGSGCTFSYTQGYTAEPQPYPGGFAVSAVSWFDNSAGLSASYPQAPVGRVAFGDGSGDTSSPYLGSWLVLPEPGALASGAAAIAVLAGATRRRLRSVG